MKKLFYLIISLTVLYSVSSLNLKQERTTRSFERSIFLEIDCKKDSSLFVPYSNAWLDSWRFIDPALQSYGSTLMNMDKYLSAFDKRNDNLWTLLHPKIINGVLTLYSPYDPYSFTANDEGELRYPIKGTGSNDNFLNSQELRDQMCYYLGRFGLQSDIPMTNVYGEDSVVILPDGTMAFLYPPRDYFWFQDTEIKKYRVRVNIMVNKNGEEKKRVIKAIAPVTFEIEEGQIKGERELFWLDYNEIKPILKEGYFFDKQGKPVTYLKYIDEKVKAAILIH